MENLTIIFAAISVVIISYFLISGDKTPLRSILRAITGEKCATLHFYVQDLMGGPSPAVYEVARASITSDSPTSFGQVLVLDNPLTAQPEINSENIGRLQGIIASADLNTSTFFMSETFVFTAGPHRGSTICLNGRNEFTADVREMAIVGGTGKFRAARGYAVLTTYSRDTTTGNGVLDYKIYVTYDG